ncbi:hypothetical protein [Pedobacter sp.]
MSLAWYNDEIIWKFRVLLIGFDSPAFGKKFFVDDTSVYLAIVTRTKMLCTAKGFKAPRSPKNQPANKLNNQHFTSSRATFS